MDDLTQTTPQQQDPPNKTSAQHRAAASRNRQQAQRRRGGIRVAVAGATMFFAVFSLLSYRMYVGLDPLMGNQGRAQTTALSQNVPDELDHFEEELDEHDEGTDEDDSYRSSAAPSARSMTNQQSPVTTTPQPTTRAS